MTAWLDRMRRADEAAQGHDQALAALAEAEAEIARLQREAQIAADEAVAAHLGTYAVTSAQDWRMLFEAVDASDLKCEFGEHPLSGVLLSRIVGAMAGEGTGFHLPEWHRAPYAGEEMADQAERLARPALCAPRAHDNYPTASKDLKYLIARYRALPRK